MRRIEGISGSSRPIKCWSTLALSLEMSACRAYRLVAGKAMLVPLTGSLYCPGRLGACEKVLIDIGTGYYVRKTREEAREFFDRKLEMVHANVEALQRIISEKQKNLESVNIIMSQKMRTEDVSV